MLKRWNVGTSMRRRTRIIWIGLLLALFLGFRGLRFSEPPGLDQGLFAYFGQHIPQGDVPYRDIWDSKPPGIFYLYALAFGLFGDQMGSVYLFESLYLAGTVLALYGLARGLFGTRAAMFAAGIAIVVQNAPLFGGFWASAQAETFMGLPIVGAIWLMVDRARREKVYAAVLAGVLLGLAICLKVTAVLFVPAFLVYILLYPPRGARNRWAWFTCGLALPLGIVAVYFGAEHALGELWNAVFMYSWGYAREIGRHQSFLRAAIYQGVHFVRMNPTAWVLSTIGVVHLLWRRRSPEMLFTLSWLLLSFGIVWTQRQFAGYHFVLLVTPLAVIGGYGAAALPDLLCLKSNVLFRKGDHQVASRRAGQDVRRETADGRQTVSRLLFAVSRTHKAESSSLRPNVRAILVGVFLVVILYLDLREYVETYRADFAYRFGGMSRAAYWHTFDRGTLSFADHRAIGEYLRDRTEDRDPILVWGLAPAIYFCAERRAVTRYVFHHVLLTGAPLSRNFPGLDARRDTFMRRLHDARPKYIVVGLNDPNGFEPQDSYRQMLEFPAFRRYVSENYHPERRMRNVLLLRRIEIRDV